MFWCRWLFVNARHCHVTPVWNGTNSSCWNCTNLPSPLLVLWLNLSLSYCHSLFPPLTFSHSSTLHWNWVNTSLPRRSVTLLLQLTEGVLKKKGSFQFKDLTLTLLGSYFLVRRGHWLEILTWNLRKKSDDHKGFKVHPKTGNLVNVYPSPWRRIKVFQALQ